MNKISKTLVVATALLSASSVAYADLAETKGGVTIRSEDGRFEAKFGGRIHLDANIPLNDDADNNAEGIGDQTTDIYFRRARLTLTGKAYGWSYKFENDFAGQSEDSGSGFREMWIGTKLGAANLRVGQAKPYRGMEELTSSNEVSFIERPFASATSIYGDRQYTTGLFVDGSRDRWGWGLSAYNLRAGDGPETDGLGASARVYALPIMSDTGLLHLGLSASIDNPANQYSVAPSSARYAGRSGPKQSFAGVASTEDQTTVGAELAGQMGRFTAQSEYAAATFSQPVGNDLDVDTFYAQFSYMLSGGVKRYDIKKGVFKSPKLKSAAGAWEAKVRYDSIESDGLPVDSKASHFIVGLNWYINPAVRLMLEYISGQTEPEVGPESALDAFVTRLQFAF